MINDDLGIEDMARMGLERPILETFVDVCPRCGIVGAQREIYAEGMLEELTCHYCGYGQRIEIETVEEKRKSRKKRRQPKLDRDGKPIRHITEIQGFGGYGCFYKAYYRRAGMITALREPIDEELIARFHDLMKNPEIDPEVSYLCRWNDEEKKLIFIFGSPKSL